MNPRFRNCSWISSSVKIDENRKKYFQYIANDLTQLNSDVIRAFRKEYSASDNPELSDNYFHVQWKISGSQPQAR